MSVLVDGMAREYRSEWEKVSASGWVWEWA